jgi:predicted metalloenzyme YecM
MVEYSEPSNSVAGYTRRAAKGRVAGRKVAAAMVASTVGVSSRRICAVEYEYTEELSYSNQTTEHIWCN